MQTRAIALLAPLALAACATAGPLTVQCDEITSFLEEVDVSPLFMAAEPGAAANPFFAPLSLGAEAAMKSGAAAPTDFPVLLLSGGGQWGAFGAGFLNGLKEKGALPDFAYVTGVSTGAMQTIFTATGEARDYADMKALYLPPSESVYADNYGQIGLILKGAQASLAPLRDEIRKALCPDNTALADECRIDRLATASAPAFVGLVEARSGALKKADLNAIARIKPRATARECVTGALLASAAVPVEFQQFRMAGRAWYDGGVRRTVFETEIGAMMAAAREDVVDAMACALRRDGKSGAACEGQKDAHWKAANAMTPQPAFYVIRNGRSTVAPNADIDNQAGPLKNAARGVSIILNQNELDSLAAIRLANREANIFYQTADKAACTPAKKLIFDPSFMACLASFGDDLAKSANPWLVFPK